MQLLTTCAFMYFLLQAKHCNTKYYVLEIVLFSDVFEDYATYSGLARKTKVCCGTDNPKQGVGISPHFLFIMISLICYLLPDFTFILIETVPAYPGKFHRFGIVQRTAKIYTVLSDDLFGGIGFLHIEFCPGW